MLLDQLGQLTDQFVVPAQLEFEVDAILVGADALLVEPAGRGPDQLAVYAVERGPRQSRSASR
jgi:hypothetical protein